MNMTLNSGIDIPNNKYNGDLREIIALGYVSFVINYIDTTRIHLEDIGYRTKKGIKNKLSGLSYKDCIELASIEFRRSTAHILLLTRSLQKL